MKEILLIAMGFICFCSADIPLVINTWNFEDATRNAWLTLQDAHNAIDALEQGCRTCQNLQCDFTVGFGGSPDENGETTLDALIFDGNDMNMGGVGNLRNIKDAIGVARKVLENTEHSFLVGDLASTFATSLGFYPESLQTNYSLDLWQSWKNNNCQPNFWMHVLPDPSYNCGPYTPTDSYSQSFLKNELSARKSNFRSNNHDTIGMIVISEDGHVVAGTSTNGANHKIPGRVGDSPLPGAGAYADSEVGAATATGDGDLMMRFLPSFLAVEQMRLGRSPSKAAKISISRIAARFPNFFGGIIAVDKKGNIGAACNGMDKFPFSYINKNTTAPAIRYINCTNNPKFSN
ncbi:N(4)-(Beta-N-acetylglucosaminyl)-L-asparaginase-like [Cylas formicarius]|uniref:N(4)-(Beta-N-acetylglucosaminyl)-L-asparaginase- like n=1 Tax=Cylas formicarius TaxID=197179 RepID=UPI00295889D5|nr:N(4)-(Beta-N-acetylglucosaminyl)-L-asparaginase-like [Cylas formicarius]XP_060532215.1 N(4)-(Beta-N-acetylglucosaminyl)-L-asparaginase-like [Cylas formicarius]